MTLLSLKVFNLSFCKTSQCTSNFPS